MFMSDSIFAALSRSLAAGITPADWGNQEAEDFLNKIFEAAGRADAVAMACTLVGSAYIDTTELRVDSPAAFQTKCREARELAGQALRVAADSALDGAVNVRVRTAVNEMIAWHQSVINDKESVRAAGMTEKLLIVMTSPAVAARAGQAAPLPDLAWPALLEGTPQGLSAFRLSLRNFAAYTGRGKLGAALQQMLTGKYLVTDGEMKVVDPDDVSRGFACAAKPLMLATDGGGIKSAVVQYVVHGPTDDAIRHVQASLARWSGADADPGKAVVLQMVSSPPAEGPGVSVHQIDLGDGRIDDRLLNGLQVALAKAAAAIAPAPGVAAAPPVAVKDLKIEHGVGNQQKSYLYISVHGDLPERMRNISFNGKMYSIVDVPVFEKNVGLWLYAAGFEAENSEQLDAAIAVLARRVQVPISMIKPSMRRNQLGARVQGSVRVDMPADIATRLRGVANTGFIKISAAEAKDMFIDETEERLIVAPTAVFVQTIADKELIQYSVSKLASDSFGGMNKAAIDELKAQNLALVSDFASLQSAASDATHKKLQEMEAKLRHAQTKTAEEARLRDEANEKALEDLKKQNEASSNRIYEKLEAQQKASQDGMLMVCMMMSNMSGSGVSALAEARQLGLSDGWPDPTLLGDEAVKRLAARGLTFGPARAPQVGGSGMDVSESTQWRYEGAIKSMHGSCKAEFGCESCIVDGYGRGKLMSAASETAFIVQILQKSASHGTMLEIEKAKVYVIQRYDLPSTPTEDGVFMTSDEKGIFKWHYDGDVTAAKGVTCARKGDKIVHDDGSAYTLYSGDAVGLHGYRVGGVAGEAMAEIHDIKLVRGLPAPAAAASVDVFGAGAAHGDDSMQGDGIARGPADGSVSRKARRAEPAVMPAEPAAPAAPAAPADDVVVVDEDEVEGEELEGEELEAVKTEFVSWRYAGRVQEMRGLYYVNAPELSIKFKMDGNDKDWLVMGRGVGSARKSKIRVCSVEAMGPAEDEMIGAEILVDEHAIFSPNDRCVIVNEDTRNGQIKWAYNGLDIEDWSVQIGKKGCTVYLDDDDLCRDQSDDWAGRVPRALRFVLTRYDDNYVYGDKIEDDGNIVRGEVPLEPLFLRVVDEGSHPYLIGEPEAAAKKPADGKKRAAWCASSPLWRRLVALAWVLGLVCPVAGVTTHSLTARCLSTGEGCNGTMWMDWAARDESGLAPRDFVNFAILRSNPLRAPSCRSERGHAVGRDGSSGASATCWGEIVGTPLREGVMAHEGGSMPVQRGAGGRWEPRTLRCHRWRLWGWVDRSRRTHRHLGRKYQLMHRKSKWRRKKESWCSFARDTFLSFGLGLLFVFLTQPTGLHVNGCRRGGWLLILLAHTVDAAPSVAGGDEHLMQLNAAVIATTYLVASKKWVLTSKARQKLASIFQLLSEYSVDAGTLLELQGSVVALAPLRHWFAARGYGLKVLPGSSSKTADGRSVIKNTVGVFFRKAKFKLASRGGSGDDGSSATQHVATRVLSVMLERRAGGSIEIVAMHGLHDEKAFEAQASAIDEIVNSGGRHGVLLADVNRRTCVKQSSGEAAMGAGDLEWRRIVGGSCSCGGSCSRNDREAADECVTCELLPMAAGLCDEAQATRRATRQGRRDWSVIDRAVTFGNERGRWKHVCTAWIGLAGEEGGTLSDHAAIVWKSVRSDTTSAARARAALPKLKRWGKRDVEKFNRLSGQAVQMIDRCELKGPEKLEALDRELLDAAELVEIERVERSERGRRGTAKANRNRWQRLLDETNKCERNPIRVVLSETLMHRRSGVSWRIRKGLHVGESMVSIFEAIRRRCRNEVAHYSRRMDDEARAGRRWMDSMIRAERLDDPLQRAKVAFEAMRDRSPQEKVDRVYVNDDPQLGILGTAEAVLEETGRIGDASQDAYLNDSPAPEGAFEAFMRHFSSQCEELRAPDGSDFNLAELLTFERFEEALYAYPRHKSVGDRVNGAMSSLELLRMLGEDELREYFETAKACVAERAFPEHWKRMVFVLLRKKHGDQRRIRKRREIALMDQCMKLVFKLVKRLSYERMVGRTARTNYGWVPGHGALNAALTLDCVLGQAREVGHPIFMLFLDLAQFFPSIQRVPRRAAEFFLGLPKDVELLSRAVFDSMRASFDTAFGLGRDFGILTGDLMGGVLSPDHARVLLASISAAIAAISSGVRIWGCAKRARRSAQVMMADDWCGFQTNEESLQRQWGMWVTWAMTSGSPIGIADLEKTVVTAARRVNGRWKNVKVALKVPNGEGGLRGLPDEVPQLSFDAAYPHMGVMRSVAGCRRAFEKKLVRGVARLMQKVAAVRADRSQHILCANALKGAYVGYYAATVGITSAVADRLEAVWRKVFNRRFGRRRDAPRAGLYGGVAGKCGDALCGRHVLVDAMAAVRSTCFRALSCAEDSEERAWARSALARRCRRWGCCGDPCEWLGSQSHLRAADVIEAELDARRSRSEVFDYYILYEAWLQKQETIQRKADADRFRARAPRRNALAFVDEMMEFGGGSVDDEYGEALRGGQHPAWDCGSSRELASLARMAVPAGLAAAGICRLEHICTWGADSPVWRPFDECVKVFGIVDSKAAWADRIRLVRALKANGVVPELPMNGARRPLTSREVWEGVRRVDGAADVVTPCERVPERCVAGERELIDALTAARKGAAGGERVDWAALLEGAFPNVEVADADEWACGAPTDFDRYNGPRIVTCWPGAGVRNNGDLREWGGTTRPRRSVEEAAAAREKLDGIRVNDKLQLVRQCHGEAHVAGDGLLGDGRDVVHLRKKLAGCASMVGVSLDTDACDWLGLLVSRTPSDEIEAVLRPILLRLGRNARGGGARAIVGRKEIAEACFGLVGPGLVAEINAKFEGAEKGEQLVSSQELRAAPAVKLVAVACVRMRKRGAKVIHRDCSVELAVDECAVHMEATNRQLGIHARLQAEYDIQFAGATDGGRRADGFGGHVATAAAYDSEGNVYGGRIDEDTVGLSSYQAELSALIVMVRRWPDGARVLIAHDARSPVQAAIRFRISHTNKRAEYFVDEMLDTLLRELERFEVVVFAWGKAHSGIATCEYADGLATDFLEDEDILVVPIQRPRHVSMIATAERGQGVWTRQLGAAHVTEWLRATSFDSCWLEPGDWNLHYSGRVCARGREALQYAQQKRLLPGDAKTYRGRMAELLQGDCSCGHGRNDFEHCLFECQHSSMIRLREVMLQCAVCTGGLVEKQGERGAASVPHAPTCSLIEALRGRTSRGSAGRAAAFRWAVGCIPDPQCGGKAAKLAAVETLAASAEIALAALGGSREAREDAESVVSKERITRRWGGRWRELVILLGPLRWGTVPAGGARGGVLRSRSSARKRDWDRAAEEWDAVLAAMCAGMRCRGALVGRVLDHGARLGLRRRRVSQIVWVERAVETCRRRGTSSAARVAAARKERRERKRKLLKRQQDAFAEVMGSPGQEGDVSLAEDGVVVSVGTTDWKRRRQATPGQRKRGRKRLRGATAPGSRKKRRGRARVESDDDGSDGDVLSCPTARGGEGDDEDEPVFEVPEVGDRIRILWRHEKVWFWATVTGRSWSKESGSGIVHKVQYEVKGWEAFTHDLTAEIWQNESVGLAQETEDERQAEADYDDDAWLGPRDFEAEGARARGSAADADDLRSERRKRRAEAAGEEDSRPSKRAYRGKAERTGLVWDVLRETVKRKRSGGSSCSVTADEVTSAAKKQKKVTDAREIWTEITEWLSDCGLAWERCGSIEVDFDVAAAREQWEEQRSEGDERATQGEGGVKRR